MSVKIMGMVWDADLPRNQKYVLLGYADHADHAGRNVFPSVELMEWKTGYSERAIQSITRDLEGAGILIKDGTGPNGTNRYRINVSALPQREPWGGAEIAPPNDNGGEGGAEIAPGVQKLRKGGAEIAPKPSYNHKHINTRARANGNGAKPEHAVGESDLPSIRESTEYVRLQAEVIGACKKLDPLALSGKDQEAIDKLFELEVEPAEIRRYYGDQEKGWWWRHFWKGKRHQFPTPADIIDTLGQARAFQEMDVQDERDPVALRAWHSIEKAVEQGNASLIQDGRALEAAREIWPQLKEMTKFNKNKLKADFMQRYHATTQPSPG